MGAKTPRKHTVPSLSQRGKYPAETNCTRYSLRRPNGVRQPYQRSSCLWCSRTLMPLSKRIVTRPTVRGTCSETRSFGLDTDRHAQINP